MFGRRIKARQPTPTYLPRLRRTLLDEWCNIPHDQIDNFILSMPRCCKSQLNIAKVVGRSVNCIQKILHKFKKTGMLANNEGRGRKKIMNSITERRVIHQVKIDPKISAPKIAASTSNTLGRSVSAETVRRVLRKSGYNGRIARKSP
ncbi:HTH_Tnp_Tc3_2 domain-containing protein [Trichonephila clavipes]|nr:HTH_Tnp_Tc3_2 domain-containing protein [Trichonephila clavipes]